ncbi:MAG: CPBP family intramembrane metalloprotease [Caulobacteraceae bacterium]|nr:CPBP family intramembrane metalloprotease [Caulobacter sp.]
MAGGAALIVLVELGRNGTLDLVEEVKFDFILKQQLGAAAVSLLYVGLAVATLAAAVWRGGRGWRDLVALRPMRPGRAARRDALGIAGLTLAYIMISTWSVEHARDRSLLVGGPTDPLLITTLIANLVLLAPLAEELLFRGWIYTALRRSFSFWPSYLATLVLFAGIHWDASHTRVVQVLPLAAALGLMRERAGSIRPTIALHAVYNMVIIAIRLAYT